MAIQRAEHTRSISRSCPSISTSILITTAQVYVPTSLGDIHDLKLFLKTIIANIPHLAKITPVTRIYMKYQNLLECNMYNT